jgi:N-acetylglucosamine kinase-like BadF-type ATPase
VLAIDGGNSKTDVALVAGDGTLLAGARGPGINSHEVGVDQTALILDAVVKQAAAQVDASRSGWVALHTVACLANADLPEEEAELATAVQALGWSPTATVVNTPSPSCAQASRMKPDLIGASASFAARASTASASHRTAA